MEHSPVRVSDIIRQVNQDIYLPAIQREFIGGTDRVDGQQRITSLYIGLRGSYRHFYYRWRRPGCT